MQEFTRNKRNEPVWDLPATVKVTRMDSSLAMTMNAGSIKKDGKVVGTVDIAIGGFAFVIHAFDRSYGVECKELISAVLDKIPEFNEVERINGFRNEAAS